jgi:hypothetical protein
MVAQFKVSTGDTEAHPINRETVEYLLAGQFPWFQRNPERRVDQYFAVCPWCNNPVQLKGLYRKQDNSPHRVKDFSKTNFPEKAPTIYQKTITFDSDRFERLIHTASNQANRNAALLQISQTVADRWRI